MAKVEVIPDKKQKQVTEYVTMPVQIYRKRNDMKLYRNAVTSAESIQYPFRYDLYQIYQNIIIDSHLSACIQQRKNLILSSKFSVRGTDGEINDEKTKLLRKPWFRDFVDYCLDSMYWGYSLIQFGAIKDDAFECVELVPRQYVKPEFSIVVKQPGDIEGLSYISDGYENWTIGAGKKRDLGLLLKAAPLIMWKTNAFGAWAEYQDKFGTPFRYAKTNIKDARTKKNAEDMMNNWGVAPWAVFDKDDIVEFLESNKADAHNVFNAMIDRVNSEITKLILGQTMTMDNGSSRSQAEVHERVLEMFCEADEHFIENVCNYQLIPLMAAHGLLDANDCIEIDEDSGLDIIESSKIDIELIKTGKFTFDPEYLKNKYGSEVIPVMAEPKLDTGVQQMKNTLDLLYS